MQSIKIKSAAVLFSMAALHINAGAQQIFKISQYTENSFIHNPAAAGANHMTTIGATFRSQWAGIDGSPKTVILFGDTYFDSKNTGVGVILYSDKTGPTSRSGGEVNLSYSVKLDENDTKLMFGLGGQVLQFKVDKDKLAEFIPNDPLLASNGTSTTGDASAGVYLHGKKFNIGVSAKQLIQPKLNFVKTATNEEGRLYRHYFLQANYNIRTDEANVLVPHVEVRYQPNAPVDYEGGLMLVHKDMLQFGVSAHYKQDYTLFVGVKIDHKFLISYAYDSYIHPISVFDNGSGAHEVLLRYFFKK